AVDALDVDLRLATPLALLERSSAGELDGAGRHPGHPGGGGRARRANLRRRTRGEDDVVGSELAARDLEDDVGDSLPDLGGGAVHLGTAVCQEPNARSAGVVEALRVADVLEAEREADAAPDAVATRRVARPSGQTEYVAGELLGCGHLERRRPAD